MKKLTLILGAVVAAVVLSAASQKPKNTANEVRMDFMYTRQAIYASNQYAVWVENEKGKLVKSLQVTSFTTKGRARNAEPLIRGYIKRPLSLPTWVRRAHPDDLTDEQLDAFTVATPAADGPQQVLWDLTDSNGKRVAGGKYCLVLEATLFQECTVYYRAWFTTDDRGDLTVERTITQNNDEREGMITNVSAQIN